jgi:hypothetical protein
MSTSAFGSGAAAAADIGSAMLSGGIEGLRSTLQQVLRALQQLQHCSGAALQYCTGCRVASVCAV